HIKVFYVTRIDFPHSLAFLILVRQNRIDNGLKELAYLIGTRGGATKLDLLHGILQIVGSCDFLDISPKIFCRSKAEKLISLTCDILPIRIELRPFTECKEVNLTFPFLPIDGDNPPVIGTLFLMYENFVAVCLDKLNDSVRLLSILVI